MKKHLMLHEDVTQLMHCFYSHITTGSQRVVGQSKGSLRLGDGLGTLVEAPLEEAEVADRGAR